jgi:intracellular multiplication protein IcmO
MTRIIGKKYRIHPDRRYRDVRPASERIAEAFGAPNAIGYFMFSLAMMLIVMPSVGLGFILANADLLLLIALLYMCWYNAQKFVLPFKLPAYANMKDPNNPIPGTNGVPGKSEGISYLGNEREPASNKELWLTNSDVRTHAVFLGTTGTGKTEGLKSIVSNSLMWGSGFVYVDGKADTDLWANLYSLARRFGRDDDLLVLNYMTGNSDVNDYNSMTSNTMNPFANGSASFLSNILVSLMPDAGGDNAMWKERAVALMFALMPALTFQRDRQGKPLDISIVRDHIELKPIVRLSRDSTLPERIIRGLQGYLITLPGYVDEAFDDEGNEKPPSPDAPMYDLQIARQQHGYLSMQFTRALQSLGDEYWYIFRAQLADIDLIDLVLNRRILVGLIPSLEKSGDEAANLGKIIASTLKGMMGSTLGATVEGTWEDAIESKATRAPSPYMTVFDEVGYYTAQGMAVMAAQARSLGFALIFAAQDLPAMEKRVKQEAQSILGNCNMKIFGKLEDPLETKKFFDEHIGTAWVYESTGFTAPTNLLAGFFVNNPYIDNRNTTALQEKKRTNYDWLREQREGQVIMLFNDFIVAAQIFHAEPARVRALRVHRMLAVPPTMTTTAARERLVGDLARKLEDKEWEAMRAMSPATVAPEIKQMVKGLEDGEAAKLNPIQSAIAAVASLSDIALKAREEEKTQLAIRDTRNREDDDTQDKAAPTTKNRFAINEAEEGGAAPRQEEETRGSAGGTGGGGGAPRARTQTRTQQEDDPTFGQDFDYKPRTQSKLKKMGVGPEDIAAIKPQDLATRNGEETGALKELPEEVLAHLQQGAKHISSTLFGGGGSAE